MNLVLIAGIINSALYLTSVFIAGIVTNNPTAWRLAIATYGICYLAALVQVTVPTYRTTAIILVILSIAFGAAAGVSLLTGG